MGLVCHATHSPGKRKGRSGGGGPLAFESHPAPAVSRCRAFCGRGRRRRPQHRTAGRRCRPGRVHPAPAWAGSGHHRRQVVSAWGRERSPRWTVRHRWPARRRSLTHPALAWARSASWRAPVSARKVPAAVASGALRPVSAVRWATASGPKPSAPAGLSPAVRESGASREPGCRTARDSVRWVQALPTVEAWASQRVRRRVPESAPGHESGQASRKATGSASERASGPG